MIIIDLPAVAILIACRVALAARDRAESTVDTEESEQPPKDSSIDRARSTIGWAEGTRVEWDRHVRPVLAREFTELLRARRDPSSAAEARAGERMFGPELWPWVDPSRPFTVEPHRPSPGREGLTRILDRLESL